MTGQAESLDVDEMSEPNPPAKSRRGRILRGLAGTVAGIIVTALVALGAWHLIDDSPSAARQRDVESSFDSSRLLVLVDGDMAATAYADGQLHPIDDAADLLIQLDTDGSVLTATPVSNSVIGWPGSVVADPSGDLAYVVAVRGPIGRSQTSLDDVTTDFPEGGTLTTVDLTTGDVVDERQVCPTSASVDLDSQQRWLLVACDDEDGQLAVVPLEAGMPTEIRRFDLDADTDGEELSGPGATYASIHPDIPRAVAVIGSRAVVTVDFTLDAEQIPTGVVVSDAAVDGEWLTVTRWSPTGDVFHVADVNWGPNPLDAVLNGPGTIRTYSAAHDASAPTIVDSASASQSPEAFELNRDGTLGVAINMERSYLPGGLTALIPGRGASSLSLLSIDPTSGELTNQGPPVGFRGVLPEDAVFDADDDHLAVVVYQDHDDPDSDGWIEYFGIEETDDGPRLVRTGERTRLPRGAHDLFVIDGVDPSTADS